jgi:hypothetical protein
MTSAAIDVQMPLAYSGAIIWGAKAMKRPTPTRLDFTQWLVLNAILARSANGTAIVTDRLLGQEVALSPSTVRDARKTLAVAGLIEARRVSPGRNVADDEITITVKPEAVAS